MQKQRKGSQETICCCCSVAKLCPTLRNPMDCSMPGFPVLHYLLEFAQTRVQSQWYHPTISSSATPFSSCPQSFPGSRSFPVIQLFASGGQIIGASASASALPMNIQDWLPLDWLVWSPCYPMDSQESSTPQFKSINSSALTSIHDYWKNDSFD